jgi:AcrR family transcriptional regulator
VLAVGEIERSPDVRGRAVAEVLAAAAEAVAAEEGFDALSMWAVAAWLSAAPMALYNHFATREQQLVLGALVEGLRVGSEP